MTCTNQKYWKNDPSLHVVCITLLTKFVLKKREKVWCNFFQDYLECLNIFVTLKIFTLWSHVCISILLFVYHRIIWSMSWSQIWHLFVLKLLSIFGLKIAKLWQNMHKIQFGLLNSSSLQFCQAWKKSFIDFTLNGMSKFQPRH